MAAPGCSFCSLSSHSSVQFSCSVVSDSLQHHGLKHSRLPCPSQLLELAQTHIHWVGDAIQPSHPLIPFSSCLQPFPALGSFPMSQFFTSGGQSIRASGSASVLPMNIRLIYFRIDWFDLVAVQGTLKSLLQHHSSKASILRHSAFFMVQLSHPYRTTGKTIALTLRHNQKEKTLPKTCHSQGKRQKLEGW